MRGSKNRIGICILIVFIFRYNSFYSQSQNNIWYFGDHAGLDFNSGSPVALTDGVINTAEGCSSIADASGNLLFYTDGITVWNKDHGIMPNGSGLLGNSSTTQSALIIPLPGSSTMYYIFAIDDLGGAMTYSIVDMTLSSGLGDVTTTKNILLHSAVSEKQTSFQRCDGNIWLISHEWGTNTFFADLITTTGISSSVLSSLGTVHTGGGGTGFNSVGALKMSQQGDRLALAIRDAGVFEVFDFDSNTGIVANSKSLNPGAYYTAYGVEFSPDGTKLYGSVILGGNVIQFDLLAGSEADIAASGIQIGYSSNYTGQLQLGPDGKIYVAKTISQTVGVGYLDVINDPNAPGPLCGYTSSDIYLSGKLSILGLPNFMVSASGESNINISGNTVLCLGQSTVLTASGATTYQWSGGSSAITNTIIVSPAVSTIYYVTGNFLGCSADTDTITVNVNSISAQALFNYMYDNCTSKLKFHDLSENANAYSWNFGDGTISEEINPEHIFQQGTYAVSLLINGNTPCADSTQQTITISNSMINTALIIPNVFTPNEDGVNDEFKITGLSNCKEYNLTIYNRWGQQVFETDSPSSVSWNGKNGSKNEIVAGVYYYVLTVIEGIYQSTGISGYVSVIR